MNTMRYLCSLFGASADDLVTAETPAGLISFAPRRVEQVDLHTRRDRDTDPGHDLQHQPGERRGLAG